MGILRGPGQGRGGAPGTVPLQNPKVTSRKACMRMLTILLSCFVTKRHETDLLPTCWLEISSLPQFCSKNGPRFCSPQIFFISQQKGQKRLFSFETAPKSRQLIGLKATKNAFVEFGPSFLLLEDFLGFVPVPPRIVRVQPTEKSLLFGKFSLVSAKETRKRHLSTGTGSLATFERESSRNIPSSKQTLPDDYTDYFSENFLGNDYRLRDNFTEVVLLIISAILAKLYFKTF